jgi:hypothetical protein
MNQTSLIEAGLQNFQLGPMHAPMPSLTNNVLNGPLNTMNPNVNTLTPANNNILTSPNANISTNAIIPNVNIFNAASLPLNQKSSPQKLTETLDVEKHQ